MRLTWLGARSGLSSMVTGPRVVSMISVSSGVAAMSDLLLLGLKRLGRGLFRCIVGVGGDLHLDDLVGIGRRLAGRDLVDGVHAVDHLAPDRIFAVEEGRRRKVDEELAVGAVRVARARRADGTALEARAVAELCRKVGILR